MATNGISERKRLAAIFTSFSILIMGSVSLLQSMSLDYYSVINTIEKIIPASIALGGLGWIMGMVLDKPKKRSRIGYNNIFLNEIMKNTANNAEPTIPDGENTETTT